MVESGGTTPEHEGRTGPTRVTRADAHPYARLSPGGVQGWRAGMSTRPAGLPHPVERHQLNTARQLHFLTASADVPSPVDSRISLERVRVSPAHVPSHRPVRQWCVTPRNCNTPTPLTMSNG